MKLRGRRGLETNIRLALLTMLAVGLGGWALAQLSSLLPVWLPPLLMLSVGLVLAWVLPIRMARPLSSLVNVLEAVRRQDFALRARTDREGVVGELAAEINRFADGLKSHGLAARQSDALLAKLMAEIELPVFTFDDEQRLTVANPAAERLCGGRLEPGTTAEALGLDQALAHADDSPLSLSLPGGAGRYLVGRRPFRLAGRPHQLLVLTEAGSALGAERREAWQGLVRVLGHEINNSLAPIKSLAHTLADAAADDSLDGEELKESLALIADRADALGRFVGGYATLARLPVPRLQTVNVERLARRVIELESRLAIDCQGEPISLEADPDQLEQALINLVKNAVDAVAGDGGQVRLQWQRQGGGVLIEVVDNGPGPPPSENLFVPFFTTKSGGSGVGLLLARRIAELHEGWLRLESREPGPGARAVLWLPQRGLARR
ncbi:MAG: hypothetical protein JJU31_09710 [Wenzhouxiangella sp.]|nr:hypothetical protein [Wenzhouxiangella sp.]